MKYLSISRNQDPALRKLDHCIEQFLVIIIVSVVCLVCCSCSSTKGIYGEHGRTTQTIEHITVDTVYLSNIQYDSIYIYKDRVTDYHSNPLNPLKPSETDTVFVKDVSIEYRYKLLRDTIRVVQRDSIPYEVTIVETKELTRPLTWYDHLTRAIFWLLCGALLVRFVKFVFDLKKHLRIIHE